MITDVDGIRVGHWTDADARTGCTVVLLPAGTVGSVEVRGGAPASRELALLAPEKTVAEVHAVLLTGGSTFGLAATDGVLRWCEERGIGIATPAGPVPIVPAMGLFDLSVGDPSVRPGPEQGYEAACTAASGRVELGLVGAGTGATVSKWSGSAGVPGGLVSASARAGGLVVSALIAVNAVGDVDHDGSGAARFAAAVGTGPRPATLIGNTTIGVIATNARLDKVGCSLVAQNGHDGLARSLVPAHTRFDGDALVVAATGAAAGDGDGVGEPDGAVDRGVDVVRVLATAAVEQAVRSLGGG